MFKSYKYFIKPNSEQRKIIDTIFEGTIKIHNMYVDDIINKRELPKLGKDIYEEYLKKDQTLLQYNRTIMINEIFRLSNKSDYKKYKSNRIYPKSFTCPILPRQKDKFYIQNKHINIPYIGEVKIVYSKDIPKNDEVKSVTIIKSENSRYYIVILTEARIEKSKLLDLDNSLGLDYSSTNFAVDNNGNKYPIPHFYRDKEKVIKKKQYELSRCVQYSKNYYKKKVELYNIHENIANRRKDYLHKLSYNLANNYDYIFIEDIDLDKISQQNNLGKATYDNSYGIFISMLEYKMKERNKVLKRINKWFPSTKKCSSCGYINKEIKLSDRNWKCPNCNTYHDRDINAAINIRKEGIKLITNSSDGRTT